MPCYMSSGIYEKYWRRLFFPWKYKGGMRNAGMEWDVWGLFYPVINSGSHPLPGWLPKNR